MPPENPRIISIEGKGMREVRDDLVRISSTFSDLVTTEDLDDAIAGVGGGFVKYNPDKPPASYGSTGFGEEFSENTEDQTWEWGNQGTSSITVTTEVSELIPQVSGGAGRAMRARWIAPPASGDWVASAKVTARAQVDDDTQYGIAVLTTGTVGTPTQIEAQVLSRNGSGVWDIKSNTWTSYTAMGAATASQVMTDIRGGIPFTAYLQFRYDATTDVLSSYWAIEGLMWTAGATLASVTAPVRVGYIAEDRGTGANSGRFMVHWFRVRNDADGLLGESGSR